MDDPVETTEEQEAAFRQAQREHVQHVQQYLSYLTWELNHRSLIHDDSKTEEPEFSRFVVAYSKLQESTFGSPEYDANKKALGVALTHHYEHNRHHPEHFKAGIEGMTLVDLNEMLADWMASTKRHADGDIFKSIARQEVFYGMPPMLTQILINTAKFFQERDALAVAVNKAVDTVKGKTDGGNDA
jgi:hypothetical protein